MNDDAELERVAAALGEIAQRNVPIGPLTTYRVGGSAALYFEPGSVSDLHRLQECLTSSSVPLLVLGKGSNLLVADAGFRGICVHLGDSFAFVDIDGLDVHAGGVTPYPVLARRSVAASLTGMEWAVGIPGSVGGAVHMNAGGHGAETKDRLVACRILNLVDGSDGWREAETLGLSYRHSSLEPADIVVSARYGLAKGDVGESTKTLNEIVRWRRANQPGGQNAGSVFTNPEGDSAGRLIDLAGMKGFRIGTAMVSDKHANFIQADPSGLAGDVRKLIDAVRAAVLSRLGIELAIELQMVGWDPSPEVVDTSCS